MANKPKARNPALTLSGEPMIGDNGNRGGAPRWPHVGANIAPDHSLLPVPDASALEPDAVASEEVTDVHWPVQAEAKKPPPAKTQAPAHGKRKFAGSRGKAKTTYRPRRPKRATGGACASA
jgi:hypothetical protein